MKKEPFEFEYLVYESIDELNASLIEKVGSTTR